MQAATRTRSGKKSWLTSAEKTLRDLIENLENVEEEEVQEAIDTFDERLKAWDAAQSAVEELTEEKDMDEMVQTVMEYRDAMVATRRKLKSAWKKAHPPPQTPSSQNGNYMHDQPLSPQSSVMSNGPTPQPNVKLPKIELPRFNGDILKFNSFWQQFGACVDESDIPTVTKFNYLISVMRGDAKTALEGIPITDTNYESAKKILHEKYGRKELVIFAHVQELLSLSPSKDKLPSMYDKLLANVRSLEGLGVTPAQFGIILTPIIVSRLPEEIRMEWSRDCAKREGDLEYLMAHEEISHQR